MSDCEMCLGDGWVSDEGYFWGHPRTVACPACNVGGEQPVRASSDESQQPRDDPARPE
jgi:hypothetical protein